MHSSVIRVVVDACVSFIHSSQGPRHRLTTTVDWWRGRPPKKYFFSFPYQNDETPLFYLRKLRVPLALRGSQNPKVEGPLARCPSFPVRKSRRSSDTSQLPRKKFTTPSDPIVDQTTSPTPDDAGALIFQNLLRWKVRGMGSGMFWEPWKRTRHHQRPAP